jgi:hypothetical protein
MKRFGFPASFALFALFCGPFMGSAVADPVGIAPSVAGWSPPVVGSELTASASVPGDSTEWEACSSADALSNVLSSGATYSPASTDVGGYLCAVELALGAPVGNSGPLGPVGAGPSLPGTGAGVSQGSALTVTQGDWVGAQSIGDTWLSCSPDGSGCSPVATGSSYPVARSDVGSALEVQESGTTADGTTAPPATTPLTGVVSASAPVVNQADPPKINGAPQVGNALTASPGTWSNQPTSYAYQWDRCSNGTCAAIDGATGSTYTPVSADIGETLLVYVTGAVDPGTSYGAAGAPYPSYPTNQVLGVSSNPSPTNPAPSTVVPVTSLHTASGAVGRLTATMRWTFRYAPSYTQIAALSVEGPALGATIASRCSGKGCPFIVRRIKVRRLKRCRKKSTGHCRAPREVSLERQFHGHNLGVGTRVTVTISRAHDIGKYYRFVVRRRRAPAVTISCVAPGSHIPGKHCTGL